MVLYLAQTLLKERILLPQGLGGLVEHSRRDASIPATLAQDTSPSAHHGAPKTDAD